MEPADILRRLERRQSRAMAALEGDRLPERVRHDQDVAEQDRRVETEAADRLERRLRGKPGVA